MRVGQYGLFLPCHNVKGGMIQAPCHDVEGDMTQAPCHDDKCYMIQAPCHDDKCYMIQAPCHDDKCYMIQASLFYVDDNGVVREYVEEKDAAKSTDNSQREKSETSFMEGSSLCAARSSNSTTEIATRLYFAGFNFIKASKSENRNPEKSILRYLASLFFRHSLKLGPDSKERNKLYSYVLNYCENGITDLKNSGSSYKYMGDCILNYCSQLEIDDNKKASLFYLAGLSFKEDAALEDDAEEKVKLLSKSGFAFMDAAQLEVDDKKKGELFYLAGCEFREAAESENRNPEKSVLFYLSQFVFMNSLKFESNLEKRNKIQSYALKSEKDIITALKNSGSSYKYMGDCILNYCSQLEIDDNKKAVLFYLAGCNFREAAALEDDSEERVELLSKSASAFMYAAQFEVDDKKKGELFYLAGCNFIEAAKYVNRNPEKSILFYFLAWSVFMNSSQFESTVETMANRCYYASKSLENGESIFCRNFRSSYKYMGDFILNCYSKLEIDDNKKASLFYLAGLSFKEKGFKGLSFKEKGFKGLSFKKADAALEGNSERVELLSKSASAFMYAAKLETDNKKKVKLFSLAGSNFKYAAQLETDREKQAKLLSQSGFASMYAAQFEVDDKEKVKLFYLAGCRIKEAAEFESSHHKKFVLFYLASLFFRKSFEFESNFEEEVSSICPKESDALKGGMDAFRNSGSSYKYKGDYISNSQLEIDENKNAYLLYLKGLLLKTEVDFENDSEKRIKLLFRSGSAFMDAARFEICHKEKVKLFYLAGSAFKAAAELETDNKEKIKLFSLAGSAFKAAAELETDNKKRLSYSLWQDLLSRLLQNWKQITKKRLSYSLW